MPGPMEECMIEMRSLGFRVDIAERRIPGRRVTKTKDLFGFIDFVALHPQHGTIGVQATTRDHFSTRLDKIMHIKREAAIDWLQAGNKIWCVGWGHLKKPPPPTRHSSRQKFGRLSAVVLDYELGLKEIPMAELGGGSWILNEGPFLEFPIPEDKINRPQGKCCHCDVMMYLMPSQPLCDCEHQISCPKCGHETHKALFVKRVRQ